MKPITRDDVRTMINELVHLHEETAQFINEYELNPLPGSLAENELSNFAQPDKVKDAYIQANLLIEGVADHLIAFTRTVTEPAGSISPWTCARAALESAALASWLMYSGINVNERVKRSLAFRYEGLIQQKKIARFANLQAEVNTIENRILAVENDAIQLSYPKVVDKKGRRIGIGMQMRSITSIVENIFNDETTYRLMSAVVHAHTWAIHQISFEQIDEENLIFQKHLAPVTVAYLSEKIANFLAMPVWLKCQLFGWDSAKLRTILTSAFTGLGSSWVEP